MFHGKFTDALRKSSSEALRLTLNLIIILIIHILIVCRCHPQSQVKKMITIFTESGNLHFCKVRDMKEKLIIAADFVL
jgi:hypothetical protein